MDGARLRGLVRRYWWALPWVGSVSVAVRTFPEALTPYIFVIFLSAVLATARMGGMGPAFLAMVLSILAGTYLGEERGHLLEDPEDYPALGMFVIVGATLSWYITMRQSVEQRLRLSEARFRLALLNSPITVMEQDRDLRYRWVYNAPSGWEPAKILGKTDADLLPPVQAQAVEALKREALEMQRVVRGTVDLSVGGVERVFDVTIEPCRGRGGAVDGVTCAAMDVTTLKRVERDLRALNETLELRVAERTEALTRSHERLRQSERLAAIGQMIVVLSHESRNALQRLHACLDLLVRKFEHAPEAEKLIHEAIRAQADLQRVYDQLRDYGAPLRLETAPVPLDDIWREAWSELESARRGRDIELVECDGAADLLCEVDPFRMRQVFRNLFENAYAACGDPARVTIEVVDGQLNGQPALSMTLRDTGAGIEPQAAERAFEPFYTTKAKGTGLGLPIVQRIVHAHGGEIALASAEGGGVVVTMHLPKRLAASRAAVLLDSQAPFKEYD